MQTKKGPLEGAERWVAGANTQMKFNPKSTRKKAKEEGNKKKKRKTGGAVDRQENDDYDGPIMIFFRKLKQKQKVKGKEE